MPEGQPHAAVTGLGFMGTTHTQMLRRLGIPIEGILGLSAEEGAAAAQKLGIPHVYGSFDELLADPKVDVVHLCTPNHLHYPMAKEALKAGKHVICEKPLAMDSRESADLAILAKNAGRVGAINYNLRFYPLIQEARARIQSGETGDVRIVHGAYLQDWLFLPTDWNWRLTADEGGRLRAVADIGTHWMDMVLWMTGLKVESVLADLKTFIPTRYKPHQAVDTFSNKLSSVEEADPVKITTDDFAAILIAFKNGGRAVLTLSQVSAGRKNYFWWEVSGSKASLRWDQENPNELWIGRREQPNQLIIKDPSLMSPEARSFAAFPGGHAEGYPDTFFQLFRVVYDYIREGDLNKPRSFPTFDDGHQEMLLCDALLQSAQERKWIEL
jgi:predicted dehydrogenase